MNEAETQAEHIDPALKTAGWGVVAHTTTQQQGQVLICHFPSYLSHHIMLYIKT